MIVTTNKVKGASLFDISSCIYFYFRQSGNDPNNLDLINNNAVSMSSNIYIDNIHAFDIVDS